MHVSESIERLTALGSSLPPETRSWHGAIASGDCVAALQHIEIQLAESPSEAEARLWWVRCQLEGGQLPLGALTAPLEEILPELRTAAPLHPIATKTFLLLGSRLLARGQSRLALMMIERADELSADGSVGVEERTCIRQTLLRAIDAELERARARLESATYIHALEEKKRAVEQAPTPKPTEAAPKTLRKSSKLLSSKSIMASSAVAESDPVAAPVEMLDASDAAPQFPPREDGERPVAVAPKDRSRYLAPGLVVAGTLAILFGLWSILHPGDDDLLENLAMRTEIVPARHLEIPTLGASVPISNTENFDALQSRLDKLASGKREDGAVGAPDGAGSSPTSGTSVSSMMNSPEIDTAALKNAPALPTVDSAKSSSADTLDTLPPSRTEVAEKTPLLDPARLAQLPVEDAGSSPRVGSAKGPYVRGTDGRLYGPSVGTGSNPPVTGAKALDGSPLRAYEVEQYQDPVYFKILAATDVLDAPSSLATAVGKLEINARVQVVSRMGNWLELRSTGGKRGYIYAQDATPSR